jgi:hypothetical protein
VPTAELDRHDLCDLTHRQHGQPCSAGLAKPNIARQYRRFRMLCTPDDLLHKGAIRSVIAIEPKRAPMRTAAALEVRGEA